MHIQAVIALRPKEEYRIRHGHAVPFFFRTCLFLRTPHHRSRGCKLLPIDSDTIHDHQTTTGTIIHTVRKIAIDINIKVHTNASITDLSWLVCVPFHSNRFTRIILCSVHYNYHHALCSSSTSLLQCVFLLPMENAALA
jgi:hypothetical protein